MSAPLAAAATAPQTGLLDLERELICSVSTALDYAGPVIHTNALRSVQKPFINHSRSSTASTLFAGHV